MQIGKYQLIQTLATGGMAEVFLAKSAGPMGFEKSLVLKRILPHLATEPAFVDMFLSEARLAAQLNHPNIVQIFDFGEADSTYFIAMEYIDGANLREIIRRAYAVGLALPVVFCARVVSAACEGLAFAHDFIDPATNLPMNIVHRDISPDNILLSRQGSVKVVDFGIAKAAGVSPHTQTGVLKGKLAYMPPEQLRNEPLDRRADVYALGIVLYELLTGLKPFKASSEAGLLQAILSDPETPVAQHRPDVPEALQRILARAISKERERRYPDCASFQADLESFIVELIVSTGKPMSASQMAGIVSMMTAAAESAPPPPQKTTSFPRSHPRFTQSQPRLELSPAAAVRPSAGPAPAREGWQPEGRALKEERTSADRPSSLILRDNGRPSQGLDSPPRPSPEASSSKMLRQPDKETVWVARVGILLVLLGGGYLSQRLPLEGPTLNAAPLAAAAPATPQSLSARDSAHGSHPHPESTVSAGALASQALDQASPDAGVTTPREASAARADAGSTESGSVQQPSVGQGTLDLLVVPEAMLFLNGWQMGRTRKTSFALDAGKYTLKLVNSELHKKVEREITVSPGRTTQIDINLLEE
jgi:eukaryotic-like serine/threonine-protein kinase